MDYRTDLQARENHAATSRRILNGTQASLDPTRCATCNVTDPNVRLWEGGTGEPACEPCHVSALRYGHAHGHHTDEPEAGQVEGCPDCEGGN